ncbi:MAG: MBL fold metallo-hydrolase [Pseudomonadota bacterium]
MKFSKMFFHQFYYPPAGAYSYILADRACGAAVIVDPVLEDCERYLAFLERLELDLQLSIDTHLHADHVTGGGALAAATDCGLAMSEYSKAAPIDVRLRHEQTLLVGSHTITVLHTPGHTLDSLCLVAEDRVLTGDTLLIGATGRTDLTGGDACAQYRALTQMLMTLPADFLVYPGHDYRGAAVSTIGHERAYNPRLQIGLVSDYAAMMEKLRLPLPQQIQVAVPANLVMGTNQSKAALE